MTRTPCFTHIGIRCVGIRLGRITIILSLSFAETALCETCSGAASCQAKLDEVIGGLQASSKNLTEKMDDLTALAVFRSSIFSAQRPPMHGAQRDRLSDISPLLKQTTSDDRYQAKSKDFARYFERTVAQNITVNLMRLLPLRPPDDTRAQILTPSFLIIVLDDRARLSIHSQFGTELLVDFDPGHDSKSTITHLHVAEIDGGRFVVTADNHGESRVHDIKIMATTSVVESPGKLQQSPTVGVELKASLEFSCAFVLPRPEIAQLTGIMTVSKKSIVYFLASDSLGNITIYHRSGALFSSQHITDQPGGIKRLFETIGQTVFFITSSTYGFFNAQKIGLDGPECPVAGGQVIDVAVDPTGTYSRPALTLASGDVVIYVGRKGSTKACCELLQKIPRISQVPLQTFTLRDHLLALQVPPSNATEDNGLRELYLFSLYAVDKGYFAAPSELITLQTSFWPKQPVEFAVQPQAKKRHGSLSAHLALRFGWGTPGVDLYDLQLRFL